MWGPAESLLEGTKYRNKYRPLCQPCPKDRLYVPGSTKQTSWCDQRKSPRWEEESSIWTESSEGSEWGTQTRSHDVVPPNLGLAGFAPSRTRFLKRATSASNGAAQQRLPQSNVNSLADCNRSAIRPRRLFSRAGGEHPIPKGNRRAAGFR